MGKHRRNADTADQQPEGEAEREDVEGARFRYALCNEVTRQPVPHTDFTRDVEEEEKPEHEKQRAPKDRAYVSKKEAGVSGRRRHAAEGLNDKRSNRKHRHGIAKPHPVSLENV